MACKLPFLLPLPPIISVQQCTTGAKLEVTPQQAGKNDAKVQPRRALEHTLEEWNAQRQRFTNLYRCGDFKLEYIRRHFKDKYGFVATQLEVMTPPHHVCELVVDLWNRIRQYKRKIKSWDLQKNIKSSQKEFMVQKEAQRMQQESKKTQFFINGHAVEESKLAAARKKVFSSGLNELRFLSTPEHVTYHTPQTGQSFRQAVQAVDAQHPSTNQFYALCSLCQSSHDGDSEAKILQTFATHLLINHPFWTIILYYGEVAHHRLATIWWPGSMFPRVISKDPGIILQTPQPGDGIPDSSSGINAFSMPWNRIIYGCTDGVGLKYLPIGILSYQMSQRPSLQSLMVFMGSQIDDPSLSFINMEYTKYDEQHGYGEVALDFTSDTIGGDSTQTSMPGSLATDVSSESLDESWIDDLNTDILWLGTDEEYWAFDAPAISGEEWEARLDAMSGVCDPDQSIGDILC